MLDIREIKKDQVFYECGEYGKNVQYAALEDAHKNKDDVNYWTFKALHLKSGDRIDFGWNENYPAYKLRIYETPQYIDRNWKAQID